MIKSFASPSLLAYLTVSRFADHLPYYRLEDITGRSGYRIERSTQWRWMRELAKGVTRLTDLMWHRVRQSAVLNVDETRHTRRAMNFFQRLFDIEDRYRTADSAARHSARQEQSKPIVDEFHAWLEDVGKTRLPKDKLLGAIRYLLDRWPSFLRFLESGDIPLDNNAAERALKFPILGRKAWLFVGNAAAGHTAAKLFTLTKTCNRLHIDPFAYLQDVYARLPTTTSRPSS